MALCTAFDQQQNPIPWYTWRWVSKTKNNRQGSGGTGTSINWRRLASTAPASKGYVLCALNHVNRQILGCDHLFLAAVELSTEGRVVYETITMNAFTATRFMPLPCFCAMHGKIKLNGIIPVLGAYDYRAEQKAAFPSMQLCRHTGYHSTV